MNVHTQDEHARIRERRSAPARDAAHHSLSHSSAYRHKPSMLLPFDWNKFTLASQSQQVQACCALPSECAGTQSLSPFWCGFSQSSRVPPANPVSSPQVKSQCSRQDPRLQFSQRLAFGLIGCIKRHTSAGSVRLEDGSVAVTRLAVHYTH